jgi:hypothetical protein
VGIKLWAGGDQYLLIVCVCGWVMWGRRHAALLAGNSPTSMGVGERRVRAQPMPNRGGRITDKWSWGHNNGRWWFELDPNANSNELKQVQIFSNFD